MQSIQRRKLRETFGTRSLAAAAVGALALSSVALFPAMSPASADDAPTTLLSVDFEDGTAGTLQQSGAAGTVVDDGTGNKVYEIEHRTQSYDGLETPASLLTGLPDGTIVTVSMKAKLLPGTTDGESARWVEKPGYGWVSDNTALSSTSWSTITGTFTVDGGASGVTFYTGTGSDNTGDFGYELDDISVTSTAAAPATVQDDLEPIKDTLPFPIGAAVSSGELTGEKGKLLAKHFNQVTPENYMKPEAWYNADHSFVTENTEADDLMAYAQQNGMRVYGHNLVWHSQIPDWFFQHDDGTWLTNSDADKQILRDRLKQHIDDVAAYLSQDKFGKFGSSTNPLVSFDVVNEVVSDNAGDPDGLRQSHWYQVLGEEYIEDAFKDADAAFNTSTTNTDPAALAAGKRPIELFYNDYNTEQPSKRASAMALVQRLIADNVPIDGIGHQFHVTMSTPVSTLKDAIEAFQGIQTATGHELEQAVTELDVPTGTPVTTANQIDQGYYYKDVFDMLRSEYAQDPDIFSATVWGLTDDQSWRESSGAPLLFDQNLQAKPAYYGVTDQQLPAKQLSAIVFQQDASDVDAADAGATGNVEWSQLPLHAVGDNAGFQLRWADDHLTAYVSSTDASNDATDAASFTWGDGTSTATVNRDGTVTGDGVTAAVTSTATGWSAVVNLPTEALTTQSTPKFDVSVVDGAATEEWNTPGSLGTLQLVEPLSFTTIPEASTAPSIDGVKDAAWADASTVTTSKKISGADDGATAKVYQLWKGNDLYVLADVTDPTIDTSAADAYQQDSVEIFTDPGNAKNGSYRSDDAQMRISADNKTSFGAGDTDEAQQARLTSATSRTDHGYIVEARIDLKDGNAGLGAFEGLDYEVNDGTNGARTANFGWAEQTGNAYQTTSRWGVGELVAATGTGTGTGGTGHTNPGGGTTTPGTGASATPPTVLTPVQKAQAKVKTAKAAVKALKKKLKHAKGTKKAKLKKKLKKAEAKLKRAKKALAKAKKK